MYFDMNGIVHVCSHPEDDNPHFRITEEKIYQDIFHYIEVPITLLLVKRKQQLYSVVLANTTIVLILRSSKSKKTEHF